MASAFPISGRPEDRPYASCRERPATQQLYRFLQGAPPYSLDSAHITNFLTWLAVDRNIAASTQNQAFNAILLFFRHVLEKDVGHISEAVRAPKRRWLPVVLTRAKVNRVLNNMQGVSRLMAQVIYGGGLRLMYR